MAITFHSGEDRIVKRFISERAGRCVCPPELPVCICGARPIFRKGVVRKPSAREVGENPRSASARLRSAARTAEPLEADRLPRKPPSGRAAEEITIPDIRGESHSGAGLSVGGPGGSAGGAPKWKRRRGVWKGRLFVVLVVVPVLLMLGSVYVHTVAAQFGNEVILLEEEKRRPRTKESGSR